MVESTVQADSSVEEAMPEIDFISRWFQNKSSQSTEGEEKEKREKESSEGKKKSNATTTSTTWSSKSPKNCEERERERERKDRLSRGIWARAPLIYICAKCQTSLVIHMNHITSCHIPQHHCYFLLIKHTHSFIYRVK